MVTLVDQPDLTPEAVRRVARDATTDALAMATYADGRRGHPVLLGRDHWPGVAATALGDRGARDYLRAQGPAVRLVPCDDVADDTDVDLPDHAAAFLRPNRSLAPNNRDVRKPHQIGS